MFGPSLLDVRTFIRGSGWNATCQDFHSVGAPGIRHVRFYSREENLNHDMTAPIPACVRACVRACARMCVWCVCNAARRTHARQMHANHARAGRAAARPARCRARRRRKGAEMAATSAGALGLHGNGTETLADTSAIHLAASRASQLLCSRQPAYCTTAQLCRGCGSCRGRSAQTG